MKLAGVILDKKFVVAAIIGAIIASLALRLINRYFDPALDQAVGPD